MVESFWVWEGVAGCEVRTHLLCVVFGFFFLLCPLLWGLCLGKGEDGVVRACYDGLAIAVTLMLVVCVLLGVVTIIMGELGMIDRVMERAIVIACVAVPFLCGIVLWVGIRMCRCVQHARRSMTSLFCY